MINISEIDSTSVGSALASTYVVLVPGLCSSQVEGAEADFEATRKGILELESFFGMNEGESGAESGAEVMPMGYKLAYHFLKLGLPVHYVVIDSESSLGSYTFWEKFEDKGRYDLRFITAGGYASKIIDENVLRCAAERGDAIGVIDVPILNESATTIYNSEYVENFINNLAETTITRADNVKESSLAYGASFVPEVSFDDPYFSNTVYPGSFAYITAFAAHNLGEYPEWFATAGAVRGVLPFSNVETSYDFGEADTAALQDRTTANHRACNLVQEIRPYGNIVWGARTLFPNAVGDDGKVGLKASSFLNIRQLCCSIKKRLYVASRRFTFDPNSDTLWINFKSLITPLLEEMKSNQGIKGYKFIKEASNEKATLKAKIQIIPIEPVEDFYLTVQMVDSIVEVSE